MRGVAEAEQGEGRRAERVLQIASGAIPTPPPTRTGAAAVARRREAAAERAEQPDVVAGAQLREPVRAGPDVLEQEVERPVVVAAGDGERAREERPLVRAAAPALGGGEHRELPGIRRRPVRVGDREDDVGAVLAPADDGEPAAAERRERCDRRLEPAAADEPRDSKPALTTAPPRRSRRSRGGSPAATAPPARRGAPPRSRAPPPCRPRSS